MKISSCFYKIFHHNDNKRIIVLSDIHYYNKRNLKKLNKILNIVKEKIPDYICIPGDMIDQRYIKDKEKLINWLKLLGSVAPVIISLGNHEFVHSKKDYYSYDKELFKEINSIHNVYFLDNESKKIGSINFIGLSLPGEYYYDHKEKNPDYLIDFVNSKIKLNRSEYTILLCHTPIQLLNKEIYCQLNLSDSVNLVVCGHTHGGITPNILKRPLKGRGIISPHKKIFQKNSYGKYEINNTKFIISSGITKSSHRNKLSFLDFLFAPEITIIDIEKRQ